MRSGWRAGILLAGAAVAAVCAAAGRPARPLLLPSPVQPLDAKVPLRSAGPSTQLQLPLNARLSSRERILALTRRDGSVIGLRVVQRLTLTGTGDYFLSIPAPLLDVRAAPGSQAEPGFRRTGVLWQGFANRRRVLAADAELAPARAAAALPLRLELRATVDGRPLRRDERRSGSLRLELRLRNTTAVRVPAPSARARPVELGRVVGRILSQLRRGHIPEQPALQVDGPITSRRIVVDAPLAVAGEVRLPALGFAAPRVSGGVLARTRRGITLRFRLVLAGPEQTSATIALTGSATEAGLPDVSLTAEPRAFPPAMRPATTEAASRLLLSLARVRQYDAFLANPAPGGSVEAVYRFQTSDAPAASPAAVSPSDEGGLVVPVLIAITVVLAAGALLVLWAHS